MAVEGGESPAKVVTVAGPWGDQRDHVSRLGILRKKDYTNHRCYWL